VAAVAAYGQTSGQKEDFSAIAMVNSARATGAGRILIQITRWSTDAERARLVTTLREQGASKLLDVLSDQKPVGSIRTPDSIGYTLRYAYQRPAADGGREIVIATDRPISFWEASHQPRIMDYPFTVIQMAIGRDGKGKGTMSYATKITAAGDNIILENFDTAPVMLTEIEAEPHK
jgi:hypothetical protein